MDRIDKLPFQEQKALKLKIEDEIPKYLSGEMMQSALELMAHMRANKMPPSWQSTNTWKAIHKGQNTCVIRLLEGSWIVAPRISRWSRPVKSYNLYEKEIVGEGLQYILIANINFCGACCTCGPGWKMDFLGKEYENVCHNVPVRYVDPGEAEIGFIKRVLELMRHTIAAA